MKRFLIHLGLALLFALATLPACAQVFSKVHGKITGENKAPLVGVTITMLNKDNGQKYTMKTDSKGEFFNIAVTDGLYHVTIKDGDKLLFESDRRVRDETELNFDLAKERAAAQEKQYQGLTAEQRKAIQEKKEAEERERAKLTNLNQLLAQAQSAEDAGNYDQAVSTLKQAVQIDAAQPVLWARLGSVYLTTAAKKTDHAASVADFTEAADAYKRAVALKPADAGYHNNLGQALAKTGKTEDAIAEYNTAAQLDPANAGIYYFNLGAILTNSGKVDEANAAFDKAIATDPNKAEAYYWKGVNLLGKATLDRNNKTVAPPGTADAFNKYLALEPNGRYAASAKELLDQIGAKVETSFTKKKK